MPPDQILSTFPPAAAVGDWRERLPQIVFKRRTMPWERNPGTGVFDDSTPPWLALVVLAEGEGTLSGDVPVSQCITAPKVLAGDADTAQGRYLEVTKSIVQKIFPTIEDLHLLAHVRKVDLSDTELALGDDDGYLAVVMANRLPQPGPAAEPGGEPTSLRYTAYLVNLEGQLDDLPTKEETESSFVFVPYMPELADEALLMGPADIGTVYSPDNLVMHNIAGQPKFQPDAFPEGVRAIGGASPAGASHAGGGSAAISAFGGGAGIEEAAAAYALGPPIEAATRTNEIRQANQWMVGTSLGELAEFAGGFGRTPEKRFRFPVLVSWEFVCTGEGGFERLMNRLDSGMLGTTDPNGDPALEPEIAPTGHISLEHRTRRGEPTESWYRGPFVPQPTVRTVADAQGHLPLAHTGDQLRRVVPDGHEDVGLAAAFEIGRLLALSKPGIVGALMAWREELFGAARARSLAAQFGDVLIAGVSDVVVSGRRGLDDLIAKEMLLPYAERVPDLLGPRAKEFGSSRVPDELVKMDASTTLSGLGLDVNVVMETTKAFGINGLATLDVTVAPLGSAPLSQSATELGSLRAMADAQLDTLATETLKFGPIQAKAAPPPGARAARRRRRDELDRFIERAERDALAGFADDEEDGDA
jgi:hypothetical protein